MVLIFIVMNTYLCLNLLLLISSKYYVVSTSNNIKIPGDILLGAASSSYQIEGAWNEDGKSENIWDRFVHVNSSKIIDGSTGDVTTNSYRNINRDIKAIKELGLQIYRFSISWSRILPTGFPNQINENGIKYYNDLIDGLIENDIIPMVTIFHWDLPQSLQDLGGFLNHHIVEMLNDYSIILFNHFGDRVKHWITLNELKQICQFGYGLGTFAPGLNYSGIADYICGHNALLAHATVYHTYSTIFKPLQEGEIGIATNIDWYEPATDSIRDIEAAERKRQFDFGMYTQPIFDEEGDYPQVVKKFVKQRSAREGYITSRLPEFTHDEIEYMKGTYDFLAINHYSTYLVKDKKSDPIGTPSLDKDCRVDISQNPNWLTGSISVFRSVPWGFRNMLIYVKENYNNPVIYISENGFPDFGEIEDVNRIKYHKEYLEQMVIAVQKDKVRVKGYIAWSLMDSFEWGSGYTAKFGLYRVNFSDPNRERIPKASAKFYKSLVENRILNID